MEGHKSSENAYILGNHPEELARLDRQAAAIDRPTRLLLQAAGLAPGASVVDLGTGLGHVAQIAGELVGPTGSVLGIDRSAEVRQSDAVIVLPTVVGAWRYTPAAS